jgi:hypothetical protein
VRTAGGEGNSLATSENYRELSKAFPSHVSMVAYQSAEYTVLTLYQNVGMFLFMQALASHGFEEDEAPLITQEDIPDPKVLLKYLGDSAGYAVVNDDGLYFRNVLKSVTPQGQ